MSSMAPEAAPLTAAGRLKALLAQYERAMAWSRGNALEAHDETDLHRRPGPVIEVSPEEAEPLRLASLYLRHFETDHAGHVTLARWAEDW